MSVHGPFAQRERTGDRLVGVAVGHQPKDLPLALRQLLRMPLGTQVYQVGTGAQALEFGPRGDAFQFARLLVTERAARSSQQHAHACRLVGRLEHTPGLECLAQRHEGRRRMSVCQFHRPAGLRGQRAQGRRAVARGHLLELRAGVARAVDLADRNRYLDQCRQQSRALERCGGLRDDASDGGASRIPAPLRQAQQRKPGLRVEPEPARIPVGRFRRGEIASQAMQVALQRHRGGRCLLP